MAAISIKGGRVWDGERFFEADVLVRNGKIQKIGSVIEDEAEFTMDAAGKIVSAGLVDVHVHMRGISSWQFCIQAEMSCFPFGVTAAADASGVYGDRALLESFMVKNCVFVSVDIKNNQADFSKTEEMLAKFGDKAVGLKVYFDTEVSEVRDIKPLNEICSFARERGLIVMVHSSNSPVAMAELLDVLRKGDILTHAYHGGRNTVAADEFACIRKAKERGLIIDAGLAGHVHTDFGVLEKAIKCNALPDVISTDITKFSAYIRGGRYGLPMCMSIMRSLGMKEEDIFRAVTSRPAQVLKKSEEWGYLREGRDADIAVIEYAEEGFDMTDKNGNYIQAQEGYRCVMTIVDGQVIYRR